MGDHSSIWGQFRSAPWWAQAVMWVVLWPFVLGAYAVSRPPAERRPWALVAIAGLVMWIGIGASAGRVEQRDDLVAAGDVDLEVAEPFERQASERTSTTDRPATTVPPTTIATSTTAAPTTTAPPTTLPPTTVPPTTAPPTTAPPTAPPPTAPPPTAPPTTVSRVPDPSGCHPSYSGCLDPTASDYDCAGGSGNGPLYTGTVQVLGSDPFGLDADGDGIGCESD